MTEGSGSGGLTRRHAVSGAVGGIAVVGVLPLLASCSASNGASDSNGSGGGGSAGGAAPAQAGTKLGSVADVPVGGGKVFADEEVVVTQPTQGVYKAFSAVCTHAGCVVNRVADGSIICPCHLSRFSVADGSVQGGPAPRPLPEVKVDVKGGQASVA
ncbi:Rieske (2Fe-2S) protein [Nocardioides panaciterrulae]|uniref:Cytochrome bc1 complex Rieske iron-sulfur subunit n=1 Tax=Nocardioides panaciterrulae TaxID=661492 RepID=A0A7Y9E656_9ACTN|nr:Rieske (2Fe-2S) protein [Nocardioides panaciterrulae]NYD41712.1 Rieske Fe-S protein [Nocardioides panaciterrulae]